MSGTPRRINTDRSLGTPSTGGGVSPRPPVRPQGSGSAREDDAQSFFRSESAGESSRSRPASYGGSGGNGGGKEPPRRTGGGDHSGGGRRKKRRRSPLWLPLAIVLGVVALMGCGVVYAVGYVTQVQESIRPESDAPSIVEEIQTLEEYKGDVVNILVCGIDYEEGPRLFR